MNATLNQVRAAAGRRIAAACRISSGCAVIETRVLARQALECDDAQLIGRARQRLAGDELARLHDLVERRVRGEPVAHITGCREFYGLELACSPAALIPRPETELAVDLALGMLAADAAGPVADLGTGCGAIACALAANRPQLAIDAYESDRQAAALARRNLRGFTRRARVVTGNWEGIRQRRYRMVIANPPYLTSAEAAAAIECGLLHDPVAALDGGEDGLDGLRSAIAAAGRGLQEHCWLIIEHGAAQQDQVRRLLAAGGFGQIACHRDLAGLPRVATARRER